MSTSSNSEPKDSTEPIASGLACLTAGAGLFRAVLSGSVEKGIDDTTLKYFAVAGALLLLKRIKSLSFGDYKAEFLELQKQVQQNTELAKTAESMARTQSTAPQAAAKAFTKAKEIQPGKKNDDPWKGQFGGKSEANGRKLSAVVTAMRDDDEWFLVRLTVESTESNRPLEGKVRFYLHDSFANDKPLIDVVGGVATLRLTSWGAFTVGAIADEGETMLELDLSENRSFPALFRSR